jgi:hypothetical protein
MMTVKKLKSEMKYEYFDWRIRTSTRFDSRALAMRELTNPYSWQVYCTLQTCYGNITAGDMGLPFTKVSLLPSLISVWKAGNAHIAKKFH